MGIKISDFHWRDERTKLMLGEILVGIVAPNELGFKAYLNSEHPEPIGLYPDEEMATRALECYAVAAANEPKLLERKLKNLYQRQFGDLMVDYYDPAHFGAGRGVGNYWHCICSCGQGLTIQGRSLSAGKTTECFMCHKEDSNVDA